jgi:glycosyltransferase involved in cell wall biosynthesis
VATSGTPRDTVELVRRGQRHRVDYLELAGRVGARYLDYGTTAQARNRWRRLEERLRLDLWQALHVARVVRKEGLDVVFSLSEKIAIPLAFLLPADTRHVVHVHHPLSPGKLALLRGARISRRWTRMSVFTNAEAYVLRTFGHDTADRVRVLRGAVDTAFFDPGRVDGAQTAGEAYLMSVGLSHRDYLTLFRALAEAPQVLCQVYSTSSWLATGSTGVAFEVPVNVQLHPHLAPVQLRDCYAASRFVVIPIRHTTQWSAGVTAILEAQAMGKAVIASRSPGMSDYLCDGETGLLVDAGQPTALADAISYLWNNPDVAQAMGRRGREWVASRSSLDRWLDDASDFVSFGACP